MLAYALVGRRPKRAAQTWTRVRDSAAQTYEEPAPLPLPLPPLVHHLLPPSAVPPPPPPPELVYEPAPRPPVRTAACQTRPRGVESGAQTDWVGQPLRCTRGVQTAPPVACFSSGVQTSATPHTDAFAQATVRTREHATQYDPEDRLLLGGGGSGAWPAFSESHGAACGTGAHHHSALAGRSRLGYHPLLVGPPPDEGKATVRGGEERRTERGSACVGGGGRAAALAVAKTTQTTQADGVINCGLQTDTLYTVAEGTQTSNFRMREQETQTRLTARPHETIEVQRAGGGAAMHAQQRQQQRWDSERGDSRVRPLRTKAPPRSPLSDLRDP